MKKLLPALVTILLLFPATPSLHAQSPGPAKNIVIFLMDGYRWNDLYHGADSSLLFSHEFNKRDSAWAVEKYWAGSEKERREKLMPFVWHIVATQGQLLGNRDLGSLVNVENKYWFSYPGRSEAFTGYYDSAVNSNEYPDNPNLNVLEFIESATVCWPSVA